MATQTVEKSPLGLENPMGTDGFEFVEYTAPDIELLRSLFAKMGFPEVARHKSKNVTLHRQGDCNFIINAEPGSYAEAYAKAHGPSACAMAFRFIDAKAAHERALSLGATNIEVAVGDGELAIPAIEGIGGSRLFFGSSHAKCDLIANPIQPRVLFSDLDRFSIRVAGLDARVRKHFRRRYR